MNEELVVVDGKLRKRRSHLWKRQPEDWYVEPEWCSERLFSRFTFLGPIWDPACGMGRILDSAKLAGYNVCGSDIKARTNEYNVKVKDFFTINGYRPGSIVSNPPYGRAQEFAEHALKLCNKVALLLPVTFLLGDKRSRWLQDSPLVHVAFLTPRPSIPPGEVIQADLAPGNGTTDYAWFIWQASLKPEMPRISWLRRDQ